MFKKGKKKQGEKFADLGSEDQETNENASSETTSLRDEIAKIKSRSKTNKLPTTVSFEEEAANDDFGIQKKPLFNAETINKGIEETKETSEQQYTDDRKYNKDYLEELKRINAKHNESAREMMQNVQTLKELGHSEDEVVAPQEEEEIIVAGEEDDEMDERQLKEIEKAKEYRERRRKHEAGDFISLKKNEMETEIGPSYSKDKTLKNIFKEDNNKKQKENRVMDDDMDEESDDEEFRRLENKIVGQNVNFKTMKGINNFVKRTYNQETDAGKQGGEELKMITFEVDLDYVIKSAQESLKIDEANYESNGERIEKLAHMIEASQNDIENFQREYQHNASSLEMFQDIMDYMNDITDCLCKTEKKKEIEEATKMLDQLEENYSNVRFTQYKLDISDLLEENGEDPLDFEDDNLNYKRKTEKNSRIIKRLENERPFKVNAKMEFIIEGISQDLPEVRKDEDLSNLKYDKVALYLAGKDIFKDVVEEYTSKDIIVSRFYELKDKYIAEEAKVLEWLTEALVLFASTDMVGYDPLGYTDPEHEFHKKVDFTELPFFQEMKSIQQSYEGENQKDIEERKNFVQKAIYSILEKTTKERLKMIIEWLWNPFSLEETKNLSAALNLFIDVYYKPTRSQQHLKTLQDLLKSVLTKVLTYLTPLVMPHKSDTKFGYDMLILSTKLMRNVIGLKGILPDKNIIQIGMNNIFFPKILNGLKTFPEHEQLILLSKVIEYIPEAILTSEEIKEDIHSLKLHLNNIISRVLGKTMSYNVPEKDSEKVKSSLTSLQQKLKLNF